MKKIKLISAIASAVALVIAAIVPLWMAGCGGAGEADLPPELDEPVVEVKSVNVNPVGPFWVQGRSPLDDTLLFRISGGLPPYRIATSQYLTAYDAGLSGAITRLDKPGYFRIDPWAVYFSSVDGASESFTVTDANDSKNSTAVFIYNISRISINPSAVSVYGLDNDGVGTDNTADDLTFSIIGGSGSFQVSSSSSLIDPPASITKINPSLYRFTVDPDNVTDASTVVTLTVSDSLAMTQTIFITVRPPTPGLSIQPDEYEIRAFANPDGNTTDDLPFTILGGVPPYTVTSSDPALALPSAISASYTFTVDPGTTGVVNTTTEVTITVNDAVGSSPATAAISILE